MNKNVIHIENYGIGEGFPCFIIAEAGVNHNGDMGLARELIDLAADAGADAVKFQTFDPEKLVSASARKAAYQVANTRNNDSQLSMLKQLSLPRDAHKGLIEHAKNKDIMFLSSPFDEGSADFLEKLHLSAFKIPSGEITNLPFIRHLAQKGKPLLLSTGMSTLLEVETAVNEIQAFNTPVGLFHCLSNYPAAAAECNLRAIQTLKNHFNLPTGWSDHTEGTHIAVAAAAMGASLIEKHFTLDKRLPGPDHKASLDPSELVNLVQQIRDTESAFGDGIKEPKPSERDVMLVARKSLFTCRPLNAGDVISKDDVICLRPGNGLSPSQLDQLVGKNITKDIPAYTQLENSHFAESNS